MKKMILITSITIAFIVSFIIFKRTQKSVTAPVYTIGILQTASHPALDASRDGFVEELQHTIGNIAFVIQNAQGSVTHAHAIAQQISRKQTITGIFCNCHPCRSSYERN